MFLTKATSNFIFFIERQPTRGLLLVLNTASSSEAMTEEGGIGLFCLPDGPEFIAEATSIIGQAHLDTIPAEIQQTVSRPRNAGLDYSELTGC